MNSNKHPLHIVFLILAVICFMAMLYMAWNADHTGPMDPYYGPRATAAALFGICFSCLCKLFSAPGERK